MRRWLDRKRVLYAYLILNAPLVAGALLVPPPIDVGLMTWVALLAVTALVVGVSVQRPPTAAAWWLITVGLAVNTVAPATYTLSLLITESPPWGWLVPIMVALSLPFLIVGLAMLGRQRGQRDTADLLDTTMIALAIFLVIFALVLHPVLPSSNSAVLTAVVFPLGALLVLVTIVWVALNVWVPTLSIGLLLSAMTCRVAALVFLMLPEIGNGTIGVSWFSQALFIAFAVLLGAAALHPSLADRPVPVPRRHNTVSRRRIGLLALLAVIAPIAWGGEIARTTGIGRLSITVPLLISAMLLLLVVARLGLAAGLAQRRAAELTERTEELAQSVQEQGLLQRQLRHQATHDPLTGLANRVVLAERMEWTLSRPDAGALSLAVINLDRFKDVNDAFGHAIGDQLLVEVSHRLLAATPPGATLARLGGDEFAALLEETTSQEASNWSERVGRSLRQPYRIGDHDLYLSASIGLLTTEAVRPAPTPSEALRDADLALSAAKAAGRDRTQLFRPELRTARTDYRWLRTGLQRALAHDEMALHYQPVVNLATGGIVAVEALLRWAPYGQPPLLPANFISVAEDAGLIGQIGTWVMRRACRDARPWYVEKGVAVTVNVSPHQLEDSGFADMVIHALRDASLPGRALILEITETSLIASANAEQAMDQLDTLRQHDVRVAIDDFGTGYSSLANLARLPVDIVKIDSSFVQNGVHADGAQGWAFTKAILNLVDSLRLDAVAEGVETLEQADTLRNLRCPLAQGYLFARPMAPSLLTQALAESPVTAAPGRPSFPSSRAA